MVTTMEITKFTTTNITDDHVNLYLPIQKVDEERRIVSGFATLDNLDKHNDIVTSDASRKAFKSFRGNIREMHMPKAVGRMVNFTEKSLEVNGQRYDGIYVEVYVSKGAQDTWEKVLDKTLSGFSIGGNINPKAVEKNETGGRVIKDYQLTELSLVDSPANPLANVFSIQKSDDGDYTFTGFATESTDFDEEEVESVEKADTGSYVVDDSVSITTSSTDFVVSGADSGSNTTFTINTTPASTISEETIAERVVKALQDFFSTKTIGGNDMTTQTEETAVEKVDEAETEEVVESVEDTAVEKAADVSEVEVDETEDAVDNIDLIVEKVLERLNSGNNPAEVAEETSDEEEVSVAKSEDLNNVEEAFTKSLDSLAKTVTDKLDELSSTISTLKDETNERLTGLEDASAMRKSTVTGGSLRKNAAAESDFWAGSTLGGTNSDA